MASRRLLLIALVALVGCGTGTTNEGSPATLGSTTTSASTTTEEPTATSSSSTTISSSKSPTTTSITEATTQPVVLSSDGLGIVSLGDPVDDVFAVLTDRFGSPTYDWLYESPFDVPPGWQGEDRGPAACHEGTHTGLVCFDYLRTVGWDDPGLYVLFTDLMVNPEATSDTEDHWSQVPPSFQGYGYGGGEGPALYTGDGITVGSATADLLPLGDRIMFWWNECGAGLEFRVFDTGEWTEDSIWTEGFMWGSLDDGDLENFEETGLPHEGAAVTSLGVGQRSSC